jgi:hypothetical protein
MADPEGSNGMRLATPALLALFFLSLLADCGATIDELPVVATDLATEPLCRSALEVFGSMLSCGEGDLTLAVAVSAAGRVRWVEALQPSDAATQACVTAAYEGAVFIPAARCDGTAVASVDTMVLMAPVSDQLGLAATEAARRRTTR